MGYYGGGVYGFGYWRNRVCGRRVAQAGLFDYNMAVMHVGAGGGWGGRVYNDSGAVDRGFVARDSHVAFSGGPGGIHHDPTPEEKVADRDQHRGPSEVQQHHAEAARSDKASYAKNNGGNPAHGGVAKPLAGASRGMAAGHSVGESHGAAMSDAPVAGGTHSTFAGGTHTSSTATTHRAPTVHSAPAKRTAHAAPASTGRHAYGAYYAGFDNDLTSCRNRRQIPRARTWRVTPRACGTRSVRSWRVASRTWRHTRLRVVERVSTSSNETE